MRASVEWTPELDARLKELRASGMIWDDIAVAMGLGREVVIGRARKKGWTKRRGLVEQKPLEPAAIGSGNSQRDRPPRQAGHPATWSMLNQGTVLEGASYPYPVYL